MSTEHRAPEGAHVDLATETLNRIAAELKWIVAHAGNPRSQGELVNRAKYALSIAARAALKQD